MLPLFDAAGDLATETLVFANELRTNESLSLEHVREISGCARLPRRGDETSASASPTFIRARRVAGAHHSFRSDPNPPRSPPRSLPSSSISPQRPPRRVKVHREPDGRRGRGREDRRGGEVRAAPGVARPKEGQRRAGESVEELEVRVE